MKKVLICFCVLFCAAVFAKSNTNQNAVNKYDARDVCAAYASAYPEKIKSFYKKNGDWVLQFKNGKEFFYSDGKFLPEEKLARANEFSPYQIYPYRRASRNPENYTKDDIERLRTMGSKESRARKFLPQEGSFFSELIEVGDEKKTKQQQTRIDFFGTRVTVHREIAEKLRKIDFRVQKLAQTDAKTASFLKDITEISGYFWRQIEGTKRMSNHSYGIAIDILARTQRTKPTYWQWEAARNENWMLISRANLWSPPQSVIDAFFDEGFIWGGEWAIYDTMHFEYKPELIELGKRIKPAR